MRVLWAGIAIVGVVGCSDGAGVPPLESRPAIEPPTAALGVEPVADDWGPYVAGYHDARKIVSRKISRDRWPGTWFLVYPEAVLSCEGSEGVGLVTITAGGRTYGVNGLAINRGASRGWYKFEDIWLVDESNPSGRISHKAIAEGLKLCE